MLVGNWIFALAFFLTFRFAWHWVPAEWTTPSDRIALVFQCAAFALLPGVVAICIVAAQRLNPEMWVGRTAKPNSALDINTRFILNTFEQFTAYLVAIAVVALYSPPEGAQALHSFCSGGSCSGSDTTIILICAPSVLGSPFTQPLQSISGLCCSFCSASAYRCSNQCCASSIAEYTASSRPPNPQPKHAHITDEGP